MAVTRQETLGQAVERAFAGGQGRKPFAKTADASRAEAEKLKDWLANQKGNATDGREFKLDGNVRALLAEPDGFVADVLQRLRSCQAGKPEMVRRVLKLFEYLETEYRAKLDISPFALLGWRNEDERLLMMLKYVHDDSHTRQEIADTLGINLRTLSSDISKLGDGYHFLGTEICINEIKAGNFGSDVHPVFLAMNTSDIYTLTVGLTLLSQGTVFEARANLLAGQVYSQLSDKAKALVDARAQETDVCIYDERPRFQSTAMYFQDPRDDSKRFTYFLREPKPCRVIYRDGETERTAVGILELVDRDCKRIGIAGGGRRIDFAVEQILRLEPAGEDQP